MNTNTLRLPLAVLVAAALIAGPAVAQQTPPPPAPPKPFKVPARQELKLDNGLEVSLVPYGDVPKVSIQLAVDTGNIHEGPDETWLADLTARLLKEGTKTRSAEKIAQDAAAMGGQLSIVTQPDQTLLNLEVLSESGADAVALLADVAQHPLFPAADVERVKGDMLRELAIYKTQPQAMADEALLASLYGTAHPYGRYFPTQELLAAYTPEQVRAHFDANFGAARARLYVVGRFDAAKVEQAVRAAFSGWAVGPERKAVPAKQQVAKSVMFVDRPGAVQSTVRVAVKAIDPSSEEYVKQQVMNTLLGGYFSSRVTSNIREKRGYAYSPYSSVTSHLKDAYWAQRADVTTAVTGASLKEILFEAETLRKTPPPAQELKAVQSYMAGNFILQNSSRAGIIGQLRFVDFHGLPDSYLQNYVQNVHAVTPEQIQQIAQKLLDPKAMTIVVVGDQKVVQPQLKVLPPKLR